MREHDERDRRRAIERYRDGESPAAIGAALGTRAGGSTSGCGDAQRMGLTGFANARGDRIRARPRWRPRSSNS